MQLPPGGWALPLCCLLLVLFAGGTISCSQVDLPLSSGQSANRTAAAEKNASIDAAAVEDNATAQLPLLIDPLSTRMDFGIAHLEKDITSEFTQPLEEEVWPGEELLLSLPSEEPSGKEKPKEPEPATLVEKLDFEIEIQNTSIMRDYVDYYTRRHRKTFRRWLQRSELYLPYVREVFREQGLPQDLIFLPFAESGFNPWAYSSAGAAGMWQFIPSSARHYGLTVNWWVDERRDPYSSTRAAARYLKKLHSQFGSWYLALAAYNAGEGTVDRALRRTGFDGYYELCRDSRYLRRETRYYVPKFLAILKIVKNLEDYGFQELSLDSQPELARVEIPSGTDLGRFCSSIDMSWDAFRKLNPSLRRQVSPPSGPTTVHLPRSKKTLAQNFLNNSESDPYSGYARYRIQRGDSWWRLAKRFNVPIRILKDINDQSSNLLRPGEWVVVPTGAPDRKKEFARSGDGSGTYTVQKGDTLWEIARSFGLNVATLRRANNLARGGRLLRPGQRLNIPQTSASEKRARARDRANYTVKKGDSLWEIARKYDVGIQTLRQANALDKGETLQVGTRLFIPGVSDKAQKAAVSGDAVVYTVRRGDNLWSIARRFGVSTNQILSWNSIGEDATIHPGDRLRIRLQD
ncbi:MAG: LysM peptidoglycan-binding domain-containing protein [Desulfohalobiaceae bacterium]|nr:LysM peptidoglycan-binding domain-containing protein [Desulfohalobiaceae bacterium]